MWLMVNNEARPNVLRVVVHQVVDRRGRLQFLVTMAKKQICVSQNPIVCSARCLLDQGYDPAAMIQFHEAGGDHNDDEFMTLRAASEWQVRGLGGVVPMHRRARQ
jgi:hypothetical protein